MKTLPSVAELKQIFNYDSTSGILSWKIRPSYGVYLGAEAGSVFTTPSGHTYRLIRYHGVSFYAHRAAWAIFYGEWPKGQIRFQDSNSLNTSIKNLRLVAKDHAAESN